MSASHTKASTQAHTKAPASFEQALVELEQIVAQMESGQLPLEASLQAYTRGNDLLQFCQKALAEVDQKVKILNARQQLMPFNSNDE